MGTSPSLVDQVIDQILFECYARTLQAAGTTESALSFVSPRPWRPHLLFVALGVASLVLFRAPLRELTALALSADPYSYILLIPFISAFFFYVARPETFGGIGSVPLLLLAVSLAIYGLIAMGIANIPAEYWLSIRIISILFVWAAVVALCYGFQIFKIATFPLLLLLLLIPIPSHLMEKIITSLQWGAAEATSVLFQITGVPMFRNGTNFQLPGVSIEVAKECSSIHSACALFIAGLVVGQLFLNSRWAKLCLTLLTLPIAMLTNAVRIVTLWFLGTKVNIGFFYGNLHHNGGIVFALVSLSLLMGCLFLLRKWQRV